MSKAALATPEQVKDLLGIDDFRHVTKDKLIQFVSSIPDMDKECAIECLKQFPTFVESSSTIISELRSLCDNALENSNKGTIRAIDSYQSILDTLTSMLNRPDITIKDQEYIIEQMVYVADKIDALDLRAKDFMTKVLHGAEYVGSLALVLGSAILGVKIIKK